MARFLVEAACAGLRLDQFVARSVGQSSVHAARRLIAAGGVRIDERRVSKKGVRVLAGQTVAIDEEGGAAPVASMRVTPDPSVALAPLFEDADLIAVNKPSGLSSHPLRPGERGTVANGLAARWPECADASDDPREAGLGHRLDRDTSGVLLAARGRGAWQGLRAALGDPSCEKTYIAHVSGAPPGHGQFDGAIGRHGRRGTRVVIDGGRAPLPAHTEWEVLTSVGGSSALVRARLHAGRPHQVRAHLAAAGYPILGDPIYGDQRARELSESLGITTLRLHAESIRLRHPITGAPLLIAAPLPGWATSSGARPLAQMDSR